MLPATRNAFSSPFSLTEWCEELTKRSPWREFCLPDEDIRNAEDPLDAILKRNPPVDDDSFTA